MASMFKPLHAQGARTEKGVLRGGGTLLSKHKEKCHGKNAIIYPLIVGLMDI
jgi:hypothetical protein